MTSAHDVEAGPRALREWLPLAAARHPECIALIDARSDVRWTYAALWERVAEASARIRRAGLGPGDRLGIAAARHVDTVVWILAAVDAGVAYVPFDLDYPAARLQGMAEDAAPRALVGEGSALAALRTLLPALPSLDQPGKAVALHAAAPDLCYVLFTSGSSGRPKGVAMGEGPIARLIAWQAAHARLGEAAVTLLFAPFSFDVHVQEIFGAMATAGTLVLVDDATRRDPGRLAAAIASEGVERLYLPYVALQMLADAAGDATLPLRDVVSAGEQLVLTPAIRALFARHPAARLHNHYGPTETHVVTAHTLPDDVDAWPTVAPIGVALPHVAILPGAAGEDGGRELLLGGDCLAHGYLGRPDLDEGRFITMPGGRRAYATGDLGDADGDGGWTYRGRRDAQLKIDGFRIEPGEVEAALLGLPGLVECAVDAIEIDGLRSLAAWLVCREGVAAPDSADVRRHLRDRVPEAWVPLKVFAVDALPKTPSGKLDRRALPRPTASSASLAPASGAAAHAPNAPAPATAEQRHALLLSVWREALDQPALDPGRSVFDAGARSLLVLRVLAQLRERGIGALSVADIYDAPSAAGQAARLEQALAGASGGAMVALKPLDLALADGDRVHAVIRGVGVNNDGAAKASFTAQSARGQKQAIRRALVDAGVDPASIRYVEAHGTGTALGDPIEVRALVDAHGPAAAGTPCSLGSLKSVFGHTVAAAGALGVVKAALALREGTLPGTRHFQTPNPAMALEATRFQVTAQSEAWPRGTTPRRAAVSSLGVGGTNAHLVLEEAPEPAASTASPHTPEPFQRAPAASETSDRLLPVSAASETALGALADRLAARLDAADRPSLDAVQATLVRGRRTLPWRTCVVARDAAGAAKALRDRKPAVRATEAPHRVWLFPGQGAQHPGMAAALHARFPVFREALDYALTALAPWRDASLRRLLLEVPAHAEAHSRAAAALAAVRADAASVAARLPAALDIAGLNALQLTVVAGPAAELEAFRSALLADGIESTALRVSHGFHSASMDGALPAIAAAFESARVLPASTPVYSCRSGRPHDAASVADAAGWARQVREPVRFADAIAHAAEGANTVFMELGPGQALSALVRQIRPGGAAPRVVPLLPEPDRGQDAAEHGLAALAQLWCHGVDLLWPVAANAPRAALPTYPFARDVHWFERAAPGPAAAAPPHPTLAPPMTERLPHLVHRLRTLFADIAGTAPERIDPTAPFIEQEFDSLTLTQAALEVGRVFGQAPRLRQLMEDLDHVEALAKHLDGVLPPRHIGPNRRSFPRPPPVPALRRRSPWGRPRPSSRRRTSWA